MSLEQPSRSYEKLRSSKLADVLIGKPPSWSKCPIETQAEPLPLIKKNFNKKKPALRKSSSESDHYWLEPGVSLPKCQTLYKMEKWDSVGPVNNYGTNHIFPSVKSFEGAGASSSSHSAWSWKHCKDILRTKEEEAQDFSFAPSRCQFSFSVSTTGLNFQDLETGDKYLQPCRALKRWDTWVKRRKHQQNVLGKQLSRNPCDLVLNQADNYRKVVEDRMLYTYARIPKSDKWRGHPYRWDPETRTRKKVQGSGEFEKNCPEYFYIKSKLQRGIVPEMEFIGIPLAIQREKGLVCGDSYIEFRDDLPNRKRKNCCMRKLAEKLKPHPIEMKELAVVGYKITQGRNAWPFPGTLKPDNFGKKTDDDYDYENKTISQIRMESVICLSIQEDEIKLDYGPHYQESLNKISDICAWEIDFGVNEVGTLVEKCLRIENRGTMAVNYEWEPKKFEKKKSLEALKPSPREPWLFFDRNSGIFVPGQIYDLKFYHFTKKPGICRDAWFLKTQPSLFKNAEGGKILFTAIATDKYWEEKTRNLNSYLNNRVGVTIARALIDGILHEILNPTFGLHGIEYRSYFFEKDLFEYHNPTLYYHSTLVNELKDLFQEIIQDKHEEWDLCVDTLVKLVKAQKDPVWFSKISELSKKLLRPNYVLESKNTKYWMSYQVLCEMANYIQKDYQYLRHCLSRQKKDKKSKYEFQEFENVEYKNPLDNYKSQDVHDFEPNLGEEHYIPDIKLINFVYFKNMFYIKVNLRVCEAAENIAGIIETRRSLERWGTK